MFKIKIGFIGAGNMAQAIALGLINADAIDAKSLTASAPSMKNLMIFKDAGANITHNNNDVISSSDIIFFAVKPQYLDSAIKSLEKIPHEGKVYVSILAGVKLETFEKKFQEHCNESNPYKIIRVLPNTPILVGSGCSVMAANFYTTKEEVSLVKSIMSVGGSCEVIPENLINSCSAVCGSGPAFVSCDTNFNLESNNNSKSIAFKNASSNNCAKVKPSRVPSTYCNTKRLFTHVSDSCSRGKCDFSSSECEDSEYSTVDNSDTEDLSENSSKILGKNQSKKLRDTTKNFVLKNAELHKVVDSSRNCYFTENDQMDYGLSHKMYNQHFEDRFVSNNFQNFEARSFTIGLNGNDMKDKMCYIPRGHANTRKAHTYRSVSSSDDQIDCWRWERNIGGTNYQHRYPMVSVSDNGYRRSRYIPYFSDSYFLNKLPSDQEVSASVQSYNGYYKRHNSNEECAGSCDLSHWNIGYCSDEPENWEETLSSENCSFELVGKRKMGALGCIFSQPFVKRSRHNPTLHPLQVVVIRFNQDPISPPTAAKIRFTLILMINYTFGSGFSPKFETTNLLRNGQFLVTCSDEASAKWLLKQNLTEEDGTPFVIMKLIDFPLMQVVDTFIPYNQQPVKQVLRCLAFQNPDLKTDKWLVAKRSVFRSGQCLRFFIDKESCRLLELLNWKPYFQLCRIQLQLIDTHEEEICVLCQSFSKTCNLISPQS